MGKEQVQGPRQWAWQRKPGPYSNGIVATGSRTLYTSGQVAWDEHGELVGKHDVERNSAKCSRTSEQSSRTPAVRSTTW